MIKRLSHRFKTLFLRVFPLLAILSTTRIPLSAQNSPVFEALTEPKEAVVGAPFELIFRLREAEGRGFQPPAMSDFKLLAGPAMESSSGFVNGKTFTQQSWRYTLEPKKAGVFTLQPASVKVDGKTLYTRPLAIRVAAAPRNRPNVNVPPGPNDNVFVSAEIDKKSACPGRQLTWRVNLYTLLPVDGFDLIELPGFDGFYAKEKRRFDTRIRQQTLRGKKYAVKTLYEEALFPQEKGELTIDLAKVRVSVENPNDPFGSFFNAPVLLQTQPLSITVKPLPEPAPAGFTGGVGRYDWTVKTDRDSLNTDEALTLTIELRGNGDTRRFSAPKLAVPPGLEAFEAKVIAEEEYENGEEVVHTKTLEYVVLPKEPGDYILKPELVYFDPDSNKYVTRGPDQPIALHVTPGPNYHPPSAAVPDSLVDFAPVEIPQPGWADRAADTLRSIRPEFALGGAATLALLFFLLFRRKKAETPALEPVAHKTTEVPPQKKTPMRAARDWLDPARRLQQTPDPRDFFNALLEGIQGFLGERLGLDLAHLSHAEVSEALQSRRVSPEIARQVQTVWERCEQAVFAGLASAVDREETFRMAEEIMERDFMV
jgi:BatD DUF11 like domain